MTVSENYFVSVEVGYKTVQACGSLVHNLTNILQHQHFRFVMSSYLIMEFTRNIAEMHTYSSTYFYEVFFCDVVLAPPIEIGNQVLLALLLRFLCVACVLLKMAACLLLHT